MIPQFRWNANIPASLRIGHDQLRAELVRASTEPGRVGTASRYLAHLCLPHFEQEEQNVFPVFGLLDDLTISEVRPEMSEILPWISEFSARHQVMEGHHQLIRSAIAGLKQAAQEDQNREYVEFAYSLSAHERMEDEVIYPSVVLIGKYVKQSLGIQ